MERFRPGVAMIGARLDVPVVPVRLDDVDKILDPHWKWPKRGTARVSFGAPQRLSGDNYEALAKQIEDAVRALEIRH
jgi:1-acyl-sn-glycerol-3-phosphate acyltransferase